MRAPPLSVCSGRLSAASPSTLLRFSFHCASAPCAASMSSTASSVKMLAMSWSKSVTTSSATVGTPVARQPAPLPLWPATGGKDAGAAATAGATLAAGGTGAGGAAASSAARAAATMRCSSSSVACSMRASSAPCDWKNPVDSSRFAATDCMAFMQSASSSRSAVSRPTPLSNDLRTQCSSGAVRRMPCRASAMRELPDERVAGAIGLFADAMRRARARARLR